MRGYESDFTRLTYAFNYQQRTLEGAMVELLPICQTLCLERRILKINVKIEIRIRCGHRIF
jgi:hypothetical protein